MSTLSPYSRHQTAIQLSDALPKAAANQRQPYNDRSSHIDSSEILKKPIAFPYPPRPPTPGPPQPNPPIPPTRPEPTPPPSPQYLLFCSVGQQPSILVSRAEPSQCPQPNPPPSPGPRRPPPLNPRPNVPSPPPTPPHRSASPWTFSTVSSLVDLALMCLSLATWDGDTATEYVKLATDDDMYSKRHSKSSLAPKRAIVGWELLGGSHHQADPEISRGLASRRELY
ncbi:hypothetical protein F4823DRAFT_107514 [Ustulina deusta]|nr:hypothetical protein F4823DRAFT_107514 [Ustulina deusta]